MLDPEESIDQQVAILRSLFLEAEKSALPFDARDATFWRVLRARLQPVVLAYLTHEKFVQSLDTRARELRHDVLTEVYRDRLSNSDQFRNFFFELNERLKLEGQRVEQQALLGDNVQPLPGTVSIQYKTADDTVAIQGNVLKMLEKQLRDLEKEYNKQEQVLTKANEEVLYLKDIIHEKNDEIARLARQNSKLQEESVHLKVSLDAAGRSEVSSRAEAVPEVARVEPEPAAVAVAVSQSADTGQLLQKIDALERELVTTSDAAYNAFMTSSDLGIVILFMLSSFRCQTPDQLAQEMARSISTFGLKNIVGVKAGAGYHYAASNGANAALSSQLDSPGQRRLCFRALSDVLRSPLLRADSGAAKGRSRQAGPAQGQSGHPVARSRGPPGRNRSDIGDGAPEYPGGTADSAQS